MNETLKQIRINALQYSEKDMATKLGLPLSEYKEIENDKPLNFTLLIRLSQAVGKTIDDLLNAQKQEFKFDIDNAFQTISEKANLMISWLKYRMLVNQQTWIFKNCYTQSIR